MFNAFNVHLIPPPPPTDSNISIHFPCGTNFCMTYKSYQLFCYVAYYLATLKFCTRRFLSEVNTIYLEPMLNILDNGFFLNNSTRRKHF